MLALSFMRHNTLPVLCPRPPPPPHAARQTGLAFIAMAEQNPDIKTPRIDRLVKTEGLLLTHFYTAKECAPTRGSLMVRFAGGARVHHDVGEAKGL